MIKKLFWEKIGYDLIEPRNTVMRWVKACINKLIEEKMVSGAYVEQNNFKEEVEPFMEQIKTVQKDFDK